MALYNTSIGGKNDRSSHCKEEVIGGALELDIFEKVMFPVCKLRNLVIEDVCVSERLWMSQSDCRDVILLHYERFGVIGWLDAVKRDC